MVAAISKADKVQNQIQNAYRNLIKACMPFTTAEERRQIRKAFDFSRDAHQDALRKSGEPYILHPIAVALICVREIGLHDATCVICALLHDVVEDTFAELTEIEQDFGPVVAKIIDGLTKIAGVFEPGSSKQAENFRKMLLTMAHDIRVALIKLADRLHNMRTLQSMNPEKQIRIASETQILYAPLAHRIGLYAIKSELEDLCLKYLEPEAYKTIQTKLQETRKERDKYIQAFIKPIREKLLAIGIKCIVKGRVKSIASINEKIKKQQIPFEKIYDIFAIRIIIDSRPEDEITDCWRVYSTITATYRTHPDRLRDWISRPKSGGYESLHTTAMGPNGRWVEIQIRSKRMDFNAEKGMAAHWRYKNPTPNGKKEPDTFEQWLEKVRDLLENKQLSAVEMVNEFRTELVSEQIFVFTPKGELITLPVGATALDFAYSIHTNIGNTCIGAKVNHQVVKLSHVLHSGDQVEIITSKKQTAKPEWLEFVKTTKAQTKIKENLKEQRKPIIAKGKEIFDWKTKQLGITEEHPVINELLAEFKCPSLNEFYFRLGSHSIDVRLLVNFISRNKTAIIDGKFSRSPEALPPPADSLVISDKMTIGTQIESVRHATATCCNPVPGDPIIGIMDTENGLLIHRTNCKIAIEIMANYGQRAVNTRWDNAEQIEFLVAIKIIGQDRFGMLNAIVKVISLMLKKNIRSLNIDSNDGMFEAVVRFYVKEISELERVIDHLKQINGVFSVFRLEE